MTRTRSMWVLVAALTSASVASACGGGAEDVGAWPDVSVVTVGSGAPVSSVDVVADGTTVVSLWATWCAPCKRELPMLEAMAAEGTRVIGVNIGDSADAVDAFLAEVGVTFPNYIDVDGEVLSGLDVPSVPATLIVVDGEIAWQNLGEVGRDDVESALAGLG